MTDGTPFNFNVAIPEAGPGAIITFSHRDLRELNEELKTEGITYAIADTIAALDALDLEMIERLARLGIKGGDRKRAEETLPIEDLATRLIDGLLLRYKGKTLAEINAEKAPAA
jgi:hypothetical protein